MYLPDWPVERRDSPRIPLVGEPAPQPRIAVRLVTGAILSPEVYDGRHGRDAVAAGQVNGLDPLQPAGVEPEVEGQVHVGCHGEVPESIGRHEPEVGERVN